MELTHKTTILFSEKQFGVLKQIAQSKGTSVGELIRTACARVYSTEPLSESIDAVNRLGELCLPVGGVAEMKREQIPFKDEST